MRDDPRGSAGILLVTIVASCARPATAPPRPQVARMEEVVIRTEPDPLVRLDTYDAEELFHIAGEMHRAGRFEDERRAYVALIETFPESAYASSARFNLGLSFERIDDFAAAAEQYDALVNAPVPDAGDEEGRRTWLDAHFRLAACRGQLSQWWGGVAAFDAALAESWLDDYDRLEAMVGRGIAIAEAGDFDAAEVALSAVLRFARQAEGRGVRDDRGMVAEAAFRLGEISRQRYDQIVLELPLAILRERLEAKCRHLLSAQTRYLRAIRFGDAHTVAAAGFRIGSLYETLYDTVVGLDAPSDLTAEETEVYQQEVRSRVAVLLEKAIRVYEKALLVGRRAPSAHAWVSRLERSVERVRALYLEPP